MGILRSLSGNIRIRITAASPAETLSGILAAKIPLFDIQHVDDLTVQAVIDRKNLSKLVALIERRGERLEIQKRQGFYWGIKSLLYRPVLIFGLLLLAVLTVFLPERILFVQVEGNQKIETSRILDCVEDSGMFFGASRRQIRSEKVKNALLGSVPELQWAGVNTYGCVAIITVKERSVPEDTEIKNGVCSIVAAKDGVILSATVLRGNPLCKVGQAVKEGQVLVSGYTDYGTRIKAERADAEIFAQTKRALQAVTPVQTAVRAEISRQNARYSLLIGKKLINFYKDSGISDSSCAKMYSVRYLTLPGGFALPLALVTEQLTYYQQDTVAAANEENFDWLQNYAKSYLQSVMIAGNILKAGEILDVQDGVCILNGEYACSEMIGRIRSEEILQENGKFG